MPTLINVGTAVTYMQQAWIRNTNQYCATTPVGVMDSYTNIFANIVCDGDGLNWKGWIVYEIFPFCCATADAAISYGTCVIICHLAPWTPL